MTIWGKATRYGTYPPGPLPHEGRGCSTRGSPLLAGEGLGERLAQGSPLLVGEGLGERFTKNFPPHPAKMLDNYTEIGYSVIGSAVPAVF